MLGALIVVVAWATLFAPQLFGGRVFVSSDAAAFRPFADFSRERWLELHQRTFWNPFVFLGIPGTASLADARPQYLPDALLSAWDWASGRLPPLLLPLLVHLVGMLGMAALARAVWGAAMPAMVWAALAWGLLPNLLAPLALGHEAQLMAVSLMPVVLLAVHAVFRASRGTATAAAALGLALAVALLVMSGHPQIAAYAAALAALFAVERALRFRSVGRLGLVTISAGLGMALATPVWLPALLYATHSVRGGTAGGVALHEVAAWSLAGRDFASFVWPFAVGSAWPTYWGGLAYTDYPQYFGVTVVAFALIGVPRRGGPGRGLAVTLLAASAIALLLSLGVRLGPLYTVFQRLVPLVGGFRVAVAVVIVAQFALVLLAARGIDRALRGNERPGAFRRLARAGLLAVAIALLGALLLRFGPLGEGYAQAALAARPQMERAVAELAARKAGEDLALRALLIAGLIGALALRRRGGRFAWIGAPACVGLLALDLLMVSAPVLRRTTGSPERLAAPAPTRLARAAAGDSGARVMALDRGAFYSNDCVSWRVRSVSGYHGAVSRAWDEVFRGRFDVTRLGRAAAVRYVGGSAALGLGPPDYEPVGAAGEGVRRLRGAPGRAYAAHSVVNLGDESRVLEALRSPDFDPPRQALVSEADVAGSYPGSEPSGIRWLRDDPDTLALAVEAPDRAFVVVADAYFPGWTARIDGAPTAIHRVDHVLRGVVMPAGQHRLDLSYEPEGWRLGRWIGGVAALFWLLAVLACTLARTPQRSGIGAMRAGLTAAERPA